MDVKNTFLSTCFLLYQDYFLVQFYEKRFYHKLAHVIFWKDLSFSEFLFLLIRSNWVSDILSFTKVMKLYENMRKNVILQPILKFNVLTAISQTLDNTNLKLNKRYLPTTIISPWSETVVKEGASPDISHRYRPVEASVTFSKTTWLSDELWSCRY